MLCEERLALAPLLGDGNTVRSRRKDLEPTTLTALNFSAKAWAFPDRDALGGDAPDGVRGGAA
jgi:hypothetical protein